MVIYWLEELSPFLILEGDTGGVFWVEVDNDTVRPQDSRQCINMPGFLPVNVKDYLLVDDNDVWFLKKIKV